MNQNVLMKKRVVIKIEIVNKGSTRMKMKQQVKLVMTRILKESLVKITIR